MATRTRFRPIDGILLLDKPQGLSSNAALQRVRHRLGAEKGGHTGALDPLATGMLPICLGEATKIAGYLLGERKAYEVEALLGVSTDTDDADGQVIAERAVPAFDIDTLLREAKAFEGAILQRPPMYSALKREGEPLYRKARRGEVLELAPRPVQILRLDLLHAKGTRLRLYVECGSGTYIRSLIRDLGERLGCGAHVSQLRRLWVHPFEAATMVRLEAMEPRAGEDRVDPSAFLLPVEAALSGWRRIDLDAEQARLLGQGQAQQWIEPAGPAAAFDESGRALGLVEVDSSGILRAKRLFRWAAR